MANCLYLECNSGISGDMLVAALLDLGADRKVLDEALKSIPIEGFTYEISTVKKAGIACCDFNVILDKEHENHDHDMEYLHSNFITHDKHHHEHTNHAHVGHEHIHEHKHHHEHRGLGEIVNIINAAKLTERARKLALNIFDVIAEAEAKAHAVSKEEVHFHEVGAVDSIVDVLAISVCADNLGVQNIIIPRLCEGTGTIRCQHGILPVPVPAVANIIQTHGLKIEIMQVQGEFVTPTGAAAAAVLRTSDKLPSEFVIKKIGLGAGKRNYERPSILRAMLIEVDDLQKTNVGLASDKIIKLETDIDDCSGEVLAYTMERLLEAGAKDVHYKPIYMKKNRPAWELVVLAVPENVLEMEKIIFNETSTIGIRYAEMQRTILQREIIKVATPFGDALVKKCSIDKEQKYYPEYESLRSLALHNKISLEKMYQIVIEICKKNIL